jgi:hypothetical protein
VASDSHDAVKQARGRRRIKSISMPTEPTDSPPIATGSPQLDSWRSFAYWKKRWVAISVVVTAVAGILSNLEKIVNVGEKYTHLLSHRLKFPQELLAVTPMRWLLNSFS